MYETLLHSEFVQENYKTIHQDEQIFGTAKHDLSHVLNVVTLLEHVLVQLNAEPDYIQSAKIAALLHDSCVHGKKGHALNSYNMVKHYFEEHNLSLEYLDDVLSAIKDHGSSYDSKNPLTLALIMCDKIDLTHERLAPQGYETRGIRQLQHIEEVQVKINQNSCSVLFTASDGLDFEELQTFDFLDKVFRSIEAFSKYHKLQPQVLMNGIAWTR